MFNLTNLLTTTPLNNIAKSNYVKFKGNELKAFQFENSSSIKDSYTTNPLLAKMTDVARLENAMQSSEVQSILTENGIPNKLNTKAIKTISEHSQAARVLAAKIASNMG